MQYNKNGNCSEITIQWSRPYSNQLLHGRREQGDCKIVWDMKMRAAMNNDTQSQIANTALTFCDSQFPSASLFQINSPLTVITF